MSSNALNLPEKPGFHPNSLANLVPFKPGEIHNPKGAPKTKLFRKLALRELRADAGNGESNIQHVVRNLIGLAAESDTQAVKAAEFLRDTVDGRPSADTDGAAGQQIVVNVLSMRDTDSDK